jgi:glycosyltransferase involved in cell wall biosynthesis
MKVLINCSLPFSLAHGGQQIQIERTMAFLRSIGLEVEPVRWWDDHQTGDIIHYFGRIPSLHIELAHQKGIKVVMGELLTATGSRTRAQLLFQRSIVRAAEGLAPSHFVAQFNWQSYRLADAIVAMTPWESHLMHYLFGARRDRIVIVPNGVEEAFFQAAPCKRGEWLVCTATITPRKRVVELARAAVLAKTPLWVVGQAYAESDPYACEFRALVQEYPEFVRWGGPPLKDREWLAAIYRAARGFVLLSAMETRSLAAEEAAACECSLLLSDLPWARSVFGEQASYCPITSPQRTAKFLSEFYDKAPTLKPPPKPLREIDVAHQLKRLYERFLGADTASAT